MTTNKGHFFLQQTGKITTNYRNQLQLSADKTRTSKTQSHELQQQEQTTHKPTNMKSVFLCLFVVVVGCSGGVVIVVLDAVVGIATIAVSGDGVPQITVCDESTQLEWAAKQEQHPQQQQQQCNSSPVASATAVQSCGRGCPWLREGIETLFKFQQQTNNEHKTTNNDEQEPTNNNKNETTNNDEQETTNSNEHETTINNEHEPTTTDHQQPIKSKRQ